MDKKIEIFENTLLKLIVRRGTDTDRQNVVLSEGELGYTTDTCRLFVGDGQSNGGNVVGNVYAGKRSNITQFTNVTPGDYAYDIDKRGLYVYEGGSPSLWTNWSLVATNATNSSSTRLAGELSAINSVTQVYNAESPITFLKEPVIIFNGPFTTSLTSGISTISAFPLITHCNGITISGRCVSPNAKNLIVDCTITKNISAFTNVNNAKASNRFVASAPNTSLLTSPSVAAVGSTEYIVGACRASLSGGWVRSSQQTFIPLSGVANGTLTCAFRTSESIGDEIILRIVGYTV